MEYKINKSRLPTKQNSFTDPAERARILRNYAGIFPNNIKEFGNLVVKTFKRSKNYSK
jgi:hypothetical protein